MTTKCTSLASKCTNLTTKCTNLALSGKMCDEITTMLALICLFQPENMTAIQDMIYQGLRQKKIPEQQAAPTIWFTPYYVEHNPHDIFEGQPPNPISPTRSQIYPPDNTEETNLIQMEEEDEFTILDPELDECEDITYPQEEHQEHTQDDANQQHNHDTSYPFHNHIFDLSQPLKTHQLQTTINGHTTSSIIDTGASISATCTCTFPTTTPHPHSSFRTFTTANGRTTLPTIHATWHFPQLQLQIPNILTAIIPCNSRDHTRLIGLDIIHHNSKIQEHIKSSLFHTQPTSHTNQTNEDAEFLQPIKIPPVILERTQKPLPTPSPHHLGRIPPNVTSSIQKTIDKHIKSGILTPTAPSPHSAPLFTIPKSSGEWRLVSDYSTYHKCFKTNHNQLPALLPHIQHLATATHFAFIDLKDAFHQIPLSTNPPITTTFNGQHYTYTRLPMGLEPSAAILQHIIQQHLHPHRLYARAYLDDITIFANSHNQCQHYTTQVIKSLHEHNWTISKNKSTLSPQTAPVIKLGYQFGNNQLFPIWTHDTLTSIRHTISNTIPDLQSWQHLIGILNIYRPSTPHFARIIDPLLRHLKKTPAFAPDDLDKEAVAQLHNTLPLSKLQPPPHPLTAHILTDYSPGGSSAILYHSNDFTLIPIHCFSRALYFITYLFY
eukprot:GHVP01017103.1.p1 GENE.GHVP01017103.1~~GHVP01017103.1.p1  ORF type:complete len:662 (-),score=17.80 GHVP01017103.1:41-2026(-)